MNGYPVGKEAFVERGEGPGPIERGALFPYTDEEVRFWQCPSEYAGTRQAGTVQKSARTYSIIGSMYGESWSRPKQVGHATQKYDIRKPSQQLVWIEENDYRGSNGGWNIGSWLLGGGPGRWHAGTPYKWVDYVSAYHNGTDNLAFADGHSEFYYWKDEHTLQASAAQSFFLYDPDNVDWDFLDEIYAPGL